MAYREKVAWLMFFSMAVTLGPYLIYVYVVQNGQPIPLPGIGQLKLYAAAAITWAVLIGAGHLFLRLKFPSETRAPADERDHEIVRRSFRRRRNFQAVLLGRLVNHQWGDLHDCRGGVSSLPHHNSQLQ